MAESACSVLLVFRENLALTLQSLPIRGSADKEPAKFNCHMTWGQRVFEMIGAPLLMREKIEAWEDLGIQDIYGKRI